MKTLPLVGGLILALTTPAWAFPPAPNVTYFGVVRDEGGRPLDTGEGIVIVSGPGGEVTRSTTDSNRGIGVNYRVNLPMDGNTTGQLYQVSALRPTLPFSIKVQIRGVAYVPIQMAGRVWTTPKAGEIHRLDLTLGVDSDGDGLPDSWEWGLIEGDPTGKLKSLADVKPGDDLDNDGLNNLAEYQIGTYALDSASGLKLDIKEVTPSGLARLQFPIVAGRTYRLQSSTDLKTWADEPFSTTTTGAVQPWLLANDITLIDVYVPTNNRQLLTFKLRVE